MVDSADKRNFHRMNIDSSGTVSLANSAETFTVHVKDLSATGLQFNTSHQFEEAQQVSVRIEPGKTGITLPFHAQVEVIHIEEIVPEKEYAVGCKILEMLPVEY